MKKYIIVNKGLGYVIEEHLFDEGYDWKVNKDQLTPKEHLDIDVPVYVILIDENNEMSICSLPSFEYIYYGRGYQNELLLETKIVSAEEKINQFEKNNLHTNIY